MLFKLFKTKQRSKKLPQIATVCLCLGFMLFANNTYAALTATTANTIKGTRPFFKTGVGTVGEAIANGEDFKYFAVDYNGTQYTDKNVLNNALDGLAKNPRSTTPSSLETLFTPHFTTTNVSAGDADDTDGDQTFTLETVPSTQLALEWAYYDKNTTKVETLTASDKNKTFCDLAIEGKNPSLRVAGNIVLKTAFGDPNDHTYLNLKKDFLIFKAIEPTICYLGPYWEKGDGVYAVAGSGWNPNVTPRTFETWTGFPTTGFAGAKFRVIMAGVAYGEAVEATTNSQPAIKNGITLDFENEDFTSTIITLSGEWDGTVAPIGLKAWSRPQNPSTPLYSFTINKWFKFISPQDTYANAQTACIAPYSLPLKSDLTNSPASHYLDPNNHYTRTVNGKLLSEWGSVGDTGINSFYNIGWPVKDYWTKETNINDHSIATVAFDIGFINQAWDDNVDERGIVCVK